MRSRINHALAALAAVPLMTALLAGCSANDEQEPPTGATAGTIPEALDRISADALARPLYVEAGDTAALRELADSHPDRWSFLEQGIGLSPVLNYSKLLSLGPESLTYAVTVGRPPADITVVHGDHDVDAITSGAKDLGFEGDGDLLTATDVSSQVIAAEISLSDQDAVFAADGADLDWVDSGGASVADDESVADFLACLDGSVALIISDESAPSGRVGVGLQDDDGTPVAVICAEGGESTATAIEEDIVDGPTRTGQPYADYFGDPEVSVTEGDLARVVMPIDEKAPTMIVINMLIQQDLPGLT